MRTKAEIEKLFETRAFNFKGARNMKSGGNNKMTEQKEQAKPKIDTTKTIKIIDVLATMEHLEKEITSFDTSYGLTTAESRLNNLLRQWSMLKVMLVNGLKIPEPEEEKKKKKIV